MKLSDLIEQLDLASLTENMSPSKEIIRGYSSDLMSDVIAHAMPGDIWVTMQVHMNVVAIASMKEIGAVLLCHDRKPLPESI